MIYYVVSGIFIVCMLCFAITVEVRAEKERKEDTASGKHREIFSDLYVLDLYNTIMKEEEKTGVCKR